MSSAAVNEAVQERIRIRGREMAIEFALLGNHLAHEQRGLSLVDRGIELSLEIEKHVVCHPLHSTIALMTSKWLLGIATQLAFSPSSFEATR